MAANATFALKPGVWFLRVRFVIFAPDSRREPSPPSGRKSTQPTVQILEASSHVPLSQFWICAFHTNLAQWEYDFNGPVVAPVAPVGRPAGRQVGGIFLPACPGPSRPLAVGHRRA